MASNKLEAPRSIYGTPTKKQKLALILILFVVQIILTTLSGLDILYIPNFTDTKGFFYYNDSIFWIILIFITNVIMYSIYILTIYIIAMTLIYYLVKPILEMIRKNN